MKTKRIVSLFLALGMLLAVLTGCGEQAGKPENPAQPSQTSQPSQPSQTTQPSEDPEPSQTQPEDDGSSYYVYSYNAEGTGKMTYFFHLYPERAGLGNVFYAGFAFNQVRYAGTYEITDAPCEYSCYEERGASEPTVGTAPQTITFYDWSGAVIDNCGFDGDILYDMEAIAGPGSGPNFYQHDTAGAASEFSGEYEGETGVEAFSFVNPDDETGTLVLCHDGSYVDMVDSMVEGKWSMENADSGMKCVLTPDLESDPGAVITISDDLTSAVYVPDGGEEINLVNTAAAGPKEAMLLSGSAPIAGVEGMEAELTGALYEDGTCVLNASAGGMEVLLDSGTYSMGEDGFTVTFQFDQAGEVVSYIGDAGAMIDYVQAGTAIGDVNTALVISLAG